MEKDMVEKKEPGDREWALEVAAGLAVVLAITGGLLVGGRVRHLGDPRASRPVGVLAGRVRRHVGLRHLRHQGAQVTAVEIGENLAMVLIAAMIFGTLAFLFWETGR